MITEEALPTYMSMLNTLEGVRDQSGASDTPWARWTRAWTAEENRHGDAMNKYMWLTGRIVRLLDNIYIVLPTQFFSSTILKLTQ